MMLDEIQGIPFSDALNGKIWSKFIIDKWASYIFWSGKTTSKVAIQRQIKSRRNHEEEDYLKEKSFSRPKLLRISL
uniref:Uncharacterized protein n=1 Tax=Vitis vinifera TaxID=29760 RepID=F6HF10_VITVI